jgi:hypothetical protein
VANRHCRKWGDSDGLLSRGFFMVSCIVPSSPKRVSQKTVQRTTQIVP